MGLGCYSLDVLIMLLYVFMSVALFSIAVAVYSTIGKMWIMRRGVRRILQRGGVLVTRIKEDSDIVPQLKVRFAGSIPGERLKSIEGRLTIISNRAYADLIVRHEDLGPLPEVDVFLIGGRTTVNAPEEVRKKVMKLVSRGDFKEMLEQARIQCIRRLSGNMIHIIAGSADINLMLRVSEHLLEELAA